MAYAQDITLINAMRASANALGVAATWASGASLNISDDFVYELYFLFRIVHALQGAHTVDYVPGTAPNVHAFPKKPAAKQGRPRFHVQDASRAVVYQLCAGTTATDMHGHPRGLDLSIQVGAASETPGIGDVIQIYDAKYRKSSVSRIAHPELSEFARWVELFNLRAAPPAVALTFGAMNQLNGNCLVSNGQSSTECDNERIRCNIREVVHFHPMFPAFQVVP